MDSRATRGRLLFCHLRASSIGDVLANLSSLAPKVTLVTSQDLREALIANGYVIQAAIDVEPERFKRFVFVTRTSS